jgi:hypothetical protein
MRQVIAYLPLVLLPGGTALLTPGTWPRWVLMWLIAGTLYLSFKWLTWWPAPRSGVPAWRHLGYLFAWPGLDAIAFLQGLARPVPAAREWIFAFAKFVLGGALIWGVSPWLYDAPDYWRGWVGMTGIVFLLHFGLFHLLSLGWRALGVDAKPLMDWPALATSVSEFWSQRWNLAFRDLTHRHLFRPVAARYGARIALVSVFLFSGMLHDVVISLPSGAGWGGPTIYFLVQAAATFVERSSVGQGLGLGKGPRGWLFTMGVLLGPVVLIFHPPFVREVVLPFLDWMNVRS